VVFCYTLGKAQRLLTDLRRVTDATVGVHGALRMLRWRKDKPAADADRLERLTALLPDGAIGIDLA
jgi:hypothetical protein